MNRSLLEECDCSYHFVLDTGILESLWCTPVRSRAEKAKAVKLNVDDKVGRDQVDVDLLNLHADTVQYGVNQTIFAADAKALRLLVLIFVLPKGGG